MTALRNLIDTHFAFDEAMQYVVKRVVGRQRILVGLVWLELRQKAASSGYVLE